MDRKKHRETMSKMFQQFKDDWLPAQIIWPNYAGPRNLAAYEFRNSNAEIALRNRRREYEQIKYLKKKQWIKTKKTEEGLLIALTDLGKLEKLRRGAESRPPLAGDQICLVIFDIPEVAKRGRRAFREFLKRLGFTMAQLSVWQSKNDVAQDVLVFIQETHLEQWTSVYVAEKRR